MNKAKVVLDTQIFLRAAINRQSLAAKVVIDWNNRYDLITSAPTNAELNDVLGRSSLRNKFKTLTDASQSQINDIVSVAVHVEITEVQIVSRDPKDDVFLACALAGEADYLVTEDNDLLVLSHYGKTKIINLRAFADLLQASPPEESSS